MDGRVFAVRYFHPGIDMRARPLRLPGYVLGRRLGGGPTCDVFSAVDKDCGLGWAVKVLREEASGDTTNVQLFRHEAHVGLTVRHPSLVRVVRARTRSCQPFFTVMERVPGRSLRRVLRQRGWLSASLVGAAARQIAGALAAIHSAGFVHGDVKPDNVHVAPGRRATLLDLGFSHRPGEIVELVGSGYVLGTANYVAPELCATPGEDGPAADIFSLGVTLFELLTGKLPYPDGRVSEMMQCHRDQQPDSLWAWQGGWPLGLSRLVDRMMVREPERRPTAGEVARELAVLFPRLVRNIEELRRSA
jgi:eukaryotic-like serine/threonine-protein kinase